MLNIRLLFGTFGFWTFDIVSDLDIRILDFKSVAGKSVICRTKTLFVL